MLTFTKLSYLITSGTVLAILVVINIFALGSFYEQAFLSINAGIFEPLLVWSVALFVCSVILYFFSKEIFSKWTHKILVWFLPIGLILTFLADPAVSYTFPSRVDLAMSFGEVLVVLTLIFALIQKFKYKL